MPNFVKLCFLLILLENTNSVLLQRQLVDEKGKKLEGVKHFFRKGNSENLPSLPKYKRVTGEKSLVAVADTTFDPCKAAETCLNGGKCENREGLFYCRCPSTHYGKTCEILADLSKCQDNLCMNGAACVSTAHNVSVKHPGMLANFTKSQSDTLNRIAQNKMIISVQYECICQDGFIGQLCETTEQIQRCEEDYCNGHGKGTIVGDKCTCLCDHDYTGEKCERESACKDFICFNGGSCFENIDNTAGTVEAVCKCPNAVQFIPTKITGERCETLEIDSKFMDDPKMPCSIGTGKIPNSVDDWMKIMMIDTNGTDRKVFEHFMDSCMVNKLDKCTMPPIYDNLGWCYPGSTCEARVSVFDSGIAYLMPFCICPGATQGRFCEYHRDDECDPTLEEAQNNMKKEDRCTSLEHGTCTVIQKTTVCDCRKGFVGEMCETFNPCSNNPCGANAECLALPDEMTSEERGKQKELFRCLCDMEDKQTDARHCVYAGSGNCSDTNPCNHGICVTCDSEMEEETEICSTREKDQGFRCICQPGYLPPLCSQPMDICYDHLCQNNAACVATSKYQYDCHCLPGTFGSLCEHIDSYCDAFGKTRCIHGTCEEDPASTRSFSCLCDFGAYGRDCEMKRGLFMAYWVFLTEYFYLTWPAISVIFTVTFLFIAYFCCATTIRGKKKSIKNEEVVKGIAQVEEQINHEGAEENSTSSEKTSSHVRQSKEAMPKNIIKSKADQERLRAKMLHLKNNPRPVPAKPHLRPTDPGYIKDVP